MLAAFRGMHVSPAKHSYVWLPRKCDYRKDRHMDGRIDRQMPDKVIPMCRYASQATLKLSYFQFGPVFVMKEKATMRKMCIKTVFIIIIINWLVILALYGVFQEIRKYRLSKYWQIWANIENVCQYWTTWSKSANIEVTCCEVSRQKQNNMAALFVWKIE